ncbi:MAG TPA: tetratricopeptide repeat protein [Candidatus Polarisedimenticolia bacterium]|nr:tetratricopeptide repeat protein [Candidatus Polarisedimenticolia bacterium]
MRTARPAGGLCRRAVTGAALALALGAGAGSLRAQEPVAPATADEHYARANELLVAGRPEEAAASLRAAIALDPNHWQSHCRLGEIHAASRRMEEAEQELRKAVAINPDAGPCLSRLAQVLLAGERLQEAEPLLARAAGLMSQDESVLFNLGRLYERTSRPELAVEIYRRQLDAAPAGRRSAATTLKVARLLSSLGKPADAAQYFREYLEGDAGRHDVRAELAASLFSASRYDEAMAEYDILIGAGAADAAALSNAGSICLLKQQLPRAVELLDRAVAGSPREIPPRIALAMALAQSGDHERTVTVLRGVTADDPENGRAWFLMGQSLLKLGRAQEGREAIARHQSIHEKLMRERMSGKPEGHP